ncbi:MAG: cobalt transporter, partial [Gammaproteobacteria bacterium]|nr:cobalt transporter [Gammaproteobacteria bacterium]
MPHIVGAPLPEQAYSSAPERLRNNFIIASALANVGFWIILGFLSGYLLRKTEIRSNG